MPTPLPPLVKAAFISLTEAAPAPYGGPAIADRYQTVLNNYEDVEMAIKWQIELFAANNSYLTQAMDLFSANDLQAVGIWYNQSQSSPALTDPVMIINSDYHEVILTPSSPAAYKTLTILGPSNIDSIVLAPGTILNELYIGPGTIVDVLDGALTISSPYTNAYVGLIWLPFLRSTPSKLRMVTYQSLVGQVILDPGSYYGGIKGEDPQNACSTPVTSMAATEITTNSIVVNWTVPSSGSPLTSNYLFINPFFRKLNSNVWVLATEMDGDFINDTGFAFRGLEPDTFYEFKTVVVCSNGGLAAATITAQTTCSGCKRYNVCPVEIEIKASPNPANTLTLCNGVTIPKEYPEGTTLTIPYFAGDGKVILNPFQVGNNVYNDLPFDESSGTWDATGTDLGSFVDGNVVRFDVSIQI